MRFWLRYLIIMLAVIVAFFAVINSGKSPLGIPQSAWLLGLWIGGNGALYAFLRCPKCGKVAFSRMSLPGERCRFCGTEY